MFCLLYVNIPPCHAEGLAELRFDFRSSTMHPHILLNRILRHIFAFIDKRSDLCALARTCRTFNGPATDSLWETLTEISPILQQLSCIEHKYNGTPYIVRELTPEDWQVFRKLSQRVRRLHITISCRLKMTFSECSLGSICFLVDPPDPSFFFPNVHTLSVVEDQWISSLRRHDPHVSEEYLWHVMSCFLQNFMTPCIVRLRLGIDPAISAHFNLSAIPLSCPHIQTLIISGLEVHDDCKGFSKQEFALSKAVPELHCLKALTCHITSLDLLMCLPQPATLEHLRVHLLDATPHDPPRFQIGSPSHHIVSTTMVNLTLLMITYHAPGETNDNLQEFENIVTLTPTVSTRLQYVWINCTIAAGNKVDDKRPPLPSSVVVPYLLLRGLRVLVVIISGEWKLAPKLTDADLLNMARAWPCLEVLHLIPMSRSSQQASLTLHGITGLVHHCRNLRAFSLEFRAGKVPDCTDANPIQNMNVQYMGVPFFSMPGDLDPQQLAKYLSFLLPGLKEIGMYQYLQANHLWSVVAHHHCNSPDVRLFSVNDLWHVMASHSPQHSDTEWAWTGYWESES